MAGWWMGTSLQYHGRLSPGKKLFLSIRILICRVSPGEARELQPGLLVVDRTVTGEFENYITPEQQIPDAYMPVPWETCMTMGNSWSYVPNDQYKPAGQLIHMLCDVVSKNGSFVLNIAPGPGQILDPAAYERLAEIGKWIEINGEAIYGTGSGKLPVQDKMVSPQKGYDLCDLYDRARRYKP